MSFKWKSAPLLALIGGLGFIAVPGTSSASVVPTLPTFTNTGSTAIAQLNNPAFWAVGATADLDYHRTPGLLGLGLLFTQPYYTLTVTAPASAIFDNNSAYYNINHPTVQIVANFDPLGNLITSYGGYSFSNTYSIYGSGNVGGTPVINASSNPTAGTPATGPGAATWNAVYSNVHNNTTSNCPGNPCLLYGESLNAVGVDTSSNHDALGFTTNNFSGWANQPPSTANESLWMFLNGGGTQYSTSEITTNSAWNNFLAEIRTHSASNAFTPDDAFYIANQVTSISAVPLPGAGWLLGAALAGLLALFSGRRGAFAGGNRFGNFTAA